METTQDNATEPKPPVKFNASLSFSHRLPYDPLFAERVPVLQAFQLAIANYVLERQRILSNGLWRKVTLFLNPKEHLFQAAECGIYTGNSLLACAALAEDFGLPFKIIGLDTFSGFPELSKKDIALAPPDAQYLSSTLFSDTSLESVQMKVDQSGLQESIVLKKGLFSKTLPALEETKYHFVNIDCDLYEGHIECLEYFYPRMVSGGIIFFDDYHSINYPMAGKAINKFMKDKPERLCHLRFGNEGANRTKAYIVKY